MRELYTEGVAIHGDPESCVGACEGVGEALIGVRVGEAMEPRNQRFGVPTPYNQAEGNIADGVIARRQRTLRGLRTCACVESPCARTGRPDGRPSAPMLPRPVGSRGGGSAFGRAARGRPVAASLR
jgi:hypothetical protein